MDALQKQLKNSIKDPQEVEQIIQMFHKLHLEKVLGGKIFENKGYCGLVLGY
jgi:hypothetical protein